MTLEYLPNPNLRRIDIETDARVDAAKVATVKIEPWVYGVAPGGRF